MAFIHIFLKVHALASLSAKEDTEMLTTIVRYYSAWVEDDHVCIQMELCDTSVGELVNAARHFSVKEAVNLLRDVLLALDFLHR